MDSILSMEMLLSTLRMAIPLVLASVGGTLCERSGIINLGIEGMNAFRSIRSSVWNLYQWESMDWGPICYFGRRIVWYIACGTMYSL